MLQLPCCFIATNSTAILHTQSLVDAPAFHTNAHQQAVPLTVSQNTTTVAKCSGGCRRT